MRSAPIVLYTDFGSADLYVGQVKAVLHQAAPASAVIDLLNDAPSFDIEASAHLLAALSRELPQGAVTIAVVDPGVGGSRDAAAVEADGRWYVGPDNGLLSVLIARSASARAFHLDWLPQPRAASFHGRDLFAPAAAQLAQGAVDRGALRSKARLDVTLGAADTSRIIYIDHYGNAMTGIRAATVPGDSRLSVGGVSLARASVFSDVPRGEPFWYENSIGLIEIAANQSSAAAALGLGIGEPVAVEGS
jgi:S-adenosylmethionine hydrolase